MSTPAEQREFFVYAMKSLNRDYIYVGLTDNIGQRMSQHNAGHERTTRHYKPFKLILTEACTSFF